MNLSPRSSGAYNAVFFFLIGPRLLEMATFDLEHRPQLLMMTYTYSYLLIKLLYVSVTYVLFSFCFDDNLKCRL